MNVRLLDVSVLLSLLDSGHTHHKATLRWFLNTASTEGWASTAITENGFIRILSQTTYPNGRAAPVEAAALLERFKATFSDTHRFWTDEISLTDSKLFDLNALTGARQTTDAYLAGLAFRHRGRFATLDGGVQWRAVRGADATLVDRIVP